jgi:hypothetical protein
MADGRWIVILFVVSPDDGTRKAPLIVSSPRGQEVRHPATRHLLALKRGDEVEIKIGKHAFLVIQDTQGGENVRP